MNLKFFSYCCFVPGLTTCSRVSRFTALTTSFVRITEVLALVLFCPTPTHEKVSEFEQGCVGVPDEVPILSGATDEPSFRWPSITGRKYFGPDDGCDSLINQAVAYGGTVLSTIYSYLRRATALQIPPKIIPLSSP